VTISSQSGAFSNRPRLGLSLPARTLRAVDLPMPLVPTRPVVVVLFFCFFVFLFFCFGRVLVRFFCFFREGLFELVGSGSREMAAFYGPRWASAPRQQRHGCASPRTHRKSGKSEEKTEERQRAREKKKKNAARAKQPPPGNTHRAPARAAAWACGAA